MAVKANAADAASKWQQNFSASGTAYAAGVNAVKTAPGQLAAAQQDVWAQNTVAAKSRYAANSAAVTLQSWQSTTIAKGQARLASGATAGAPKMQAFLANFLPKLTQIVDNLPARGSFEQNMAKSYNLAQALHQAKGTFN
jgi:phosphate/sulfate permease